MRAEAYTNAGADAILIHSKLNNFSEIGSFLNVNTLKIIFFTYCMKCIFIFHFYKEWRGRSPVIIVPTNYYTVKTDVFRKTGVNMVIWANHNMRAAVKSM